MREPAVSGTKWHLMRPLGKRRRQLALLVIAIGIYTFFMPMVVLDPPVLNRTEWSALNIASNIYERQLPVPGGSIDEGLIEIALTYLLMPFALMALYLPGPPKALKVTSGIGFVLGSLARFWHHAFMYTFGWEYFGPEHMRRGPAWWILPWIMPALLAICFVWKLDESDPGGVCGPRLL